MAGMKRTIHEWLVIDGIELVGAVSHTMRPITRKQYESFLTNHRYTRVNVS